METTGNMNISPVFGTNEADDIRATGRNDVISGAGGDDYIQGLSGNDDIFGGTGNDTLLGQAGNDVIYGNGKPAFVDMSNLQITETREATVTFVNEGAGYRNSLGVYEIGPDGAISNVQILFANASKQGSGGDLIAGQSQVTFDVTSGTQLGFFVVSNGYGRGYQNREALDSTTGTLELRHQDGSAGNINNGAVELWHVDETGVEYNVRSQFGHDTFHSAASADDNYSLNADNYLHVVGRAFSVTGELLIGFEDIRGGGDNDYDDTVIRVDLGQQNIVSQFQPSTGSGISRPDDDIIYGGSGNDTLYGISGDDTLYGGSGDDELNGNSGEDVLYGNTGSDTLNGNSGNDQLFGGNGVDILYGNSGDDELHGDGGDDVLHAGSGNDTLNGGSNNDELNGNSGNDTLNGDSGDDTLNGNSGNDFLYGGSGRDTLNGSSGDDQLFGEDGQDTLNGGSGNDHLDGGIHNDRLYGGSGNDDLFGGEGDDYIAAGGGDDELFGGSGRDRLYGSSGSDIVHGEDGRDYINAGSGDDTIIGGTGSDWMLGGSGSDVFVFGEYSTGDHDTVRDFEVEDFLDFSFFDFLDMAALLETATELGRHLNFDIAENYSILVQNTTFEELELASSDYSMFII